MSFNIGLSGIKAASSDLNITGNNIANASTVGFKQSRAEFQDLYAASVLGTGKNAQGSGVLLGNVGQLFNQGTIDSTQNALDMGINGNGFFVTSNNGAIQYTRAGYFGTDKQGFIVDNNGYKLQGYTTNDQGLLQPGVRSDLRIETASQAPKASSSIKQTVNLNSTQTTPTTTPFNPSDPTSYNSSTSVNIYDSQGNAHVLSQYFVKGANNSWTMNVLIDGRNPGDPTAEDPTTKVATPYTVTLPFTSSGALDGGKVASTDLKQVNNATTNAFEGVLKLDNWVPAISNGGTPATWASNGAVANPAGITLDMRGSTQYSSAFAVTSVNQDGYTTGQLSGLEIDDTGQIFARYTNGQSKVQGQVVLANFANVQGLTPMGKTSWTESSESGQPVVGTPRSGTLGALQSGALEASNVDISTELVDMIVAQRNYQANAKTIETENAITQTIINLR
ncbi:flagellar hook protein FlgE [Pseudomonas oryzihabitans]|uniref:flagellar hook protein FlgE n=1 Tax=Pseudomonas oryzihabitans TaxID=47885 RepID=UPI00135D6367|nr:flagellar hook protein FlgE [Pseudomonas oryzihabitans]MXS19941.1 flagellar hook-basal body complex protein [Pseudomonas oryzihabitans]